MNIPQTYNGKLLIHQWPYYNENGTSLGIVGRYQNGDEKKDIVPFFKLNGSAGIDLNPRPLFGLDKIAKHDRTKAVFIVEGEKAAAALQSMGITALTSIGGSKAAKQTDWTPLNGVKLVYILPDNDEPGQTYAKDVCNLLLSLVSPPDVKILRLSGLPEGGDFVDWIQSFINDWDGYTPIEQSLRKALREELANELKNAESVPENWINAGSTNTGNAQLFQWEKPNEIETKTPPVMAMKADFIPEPFRPWLADVSHRMQTPPDFATVSAVVIAGSVIGAGCSIRPKRFDDWEVIPNVWGAVCNGLMILDTV
jgi:hypothetical protein